MKYNSKDSLDKIKETLDIQGYDLFVSLQIKHYDIMLEEICFDVNCFTINRYNHSDFHYVLKSLNVEYPFKNGIFPEEFNIFTNGLQKYINEKIQVGENLNQCFDNIETMIYDLYSQIFP